MKIYTICISCHRVNTRGEKEWKRVDSLNALSDANDIGYIIACPKCKKATSFLLRPHAKPSRLILRDHHA